MMVRRTIGGVLVGLVLGAGGGGGVGRGGEEGPEPPGNGGARPARSGAQVSLPRVPRRTRLAGLTPAEQEAAHTLARRLDALIVWSSNRSGTHQLYLLDLRDESLRQLTHGEHVHFYSRFSPDGRHVVF